jgi:hypothetical protein
MMKGLRSVEDLRRRDCPQACTLHTGAGRCIATSASTNVPTSLKADRFLRSGEDSSLASTSPLGTGRSSDSRVESPAFSSLRCGAESGGAGHDNGRIRMGFSYTSVTAAGPSRIRTGFPVCRPNKPVRPTTSTCERAQCSRLDGLVQMPGGANCHFVAFYRVFSGIGRPLRPRAGVPRLGTGKRSCGGSRTGGGQIASQATRRGSGKAFRPKWGRCAGPMTNFL